MTTKTTITGEVTHIGYRNSDNWGTFTVSSGEGFDQRHTSCTGTIPVMVDVGTTVTIEGVTTNHHQYGEQLKCSSVVPAPPDVSTDKGIVKLLCRLPGIGEVKAKKFVNLCNDEDIDPIETAIQRPDKIGVKKEDEEYASATITMLTQFLEHFIFLLGIGLTDNQADRIIKEFGTESSKVISENPYLLIEKIHGFGFLLADMIAFKAGIKTGNQARTQACIQYCLRDNKINGGNIYITGWVLAEIVIEQLTESCLKNNASVIGLPDKHMVRENIYLLVNDGKVIVKDGKVYDADLYDDEMSILEAVTVKL